MQTPATRQVVPMLFSNAGHFLDHMFMLLYPTVVLTLERQFSMSYGELLALAMPGFVLFGAGALPAGWLSDRWSRRGMFATFFLGIGAASVLTGLASSPLGIGVGLALIGLFASIYHPVGIAWLVGAAKNRGRALGINGVFGNMGVAFAATIAGGLATWLGWRWAFIIPGLAAIGVGLVFLAVVRGDMSKGETKKAGAERALSRRTLVRALAALAVAVTFGGLVFQSTSVALPKLFDDRMTMYADTALGVGGLVTVVFAVGSMAQILVGYVMDRFPVKPIYLLLYLGQVPLLLMAAGLAGLPLLVVAQIAVFLTMGAIPVSDMLLASLTPPSWHGRVYGAKFVLALGVSSLSVPLVGLVRDHTGSFSVLLSLLGICAATVAIAVMFLPGRGAGAAAPAPAAAGAGD